MTNPSIAECRPAAQPFVNAAAYLFVRLEELEPLRTVLRQLCREQKLKGTILLSPEGINLFVAGTRSGVDGLLAFLRGDQRFAGLQVKESLSSDQPFERMLVKIKREIIAFGVPGIDPQRKTSRRVSARELRDWLASGRDVVLLDVRNNYEVQVGTFADAQAVGVDNFRDLPEAVERLPADMKDRPVVTFCTGGIRCEKAGPYLERAGFRNVYQLDGGILKYFEEVGGDYFRGECFVFDKRVALDPALRPTATTQCYACQSPLSLADQQSPLYDPPHACPHCYQTPEQKQARLIDRRQAAIRAATTPLPGSVPYDNPRPLNVRQRFDGLTLLKFLQAHHPHLGNAYWEDVCAAGRIRQNGQPVPGDRVVRAGEQFAHLQSATTEPDVNPQIQLLYEDDALVVVSKPAPLPVHPSGRFNRNSLQWILNSVYAPLKLRPIHRLDANTTGIVVFAKTRSATAALQPQFASGEIEKVYLVRVQGIVDWERHVCEVPISRDPAQCGGRTVAADGLPSRTRFERLRLFDDGTALLQAIPETGRTNQIRVHAWHLGLPVCGDPLYLANGTLGEEQTHAPGAVMCLHAWRLAITQPVTRARLHFEAEPPGWTTGDGLAGCAWPSA